MSVCVSLSVCVCLCVCVLSRLMNSPVFVFPLFARFTIHHISLPLLEFVSVGAGLYCKDLQVLLVTGGEDGFFTYLDSTEILR